MNEYKFYVFYGMTEDFESPQEAVEAFNRVKDSNDYVAIGVTRDRALDLYPVTCDLLVKRKNKVFISNDIKTSEMKNDSLITINTINILKEAFNL